MRTHLALASLLLAAPLVACGGGASAPNEMPRLACESGCTGGDGIETSLGIVSVGHHAKRLLRVRNLSDRALSSEGLRLDPVAGLESSVHCETGCAGDRLPAGAVVLVELDWAPTAAGPLQVAPVLHLGADAFPLAITGEAAAVDLACTPTRLDFGNLSAGSSASRSISCENRGAGSLELEVGPLPDGFSTSVPRLALAAGAETEMTVGFVAKASSSGTLKLLLPDGTVAHTTTLSADVGDGLLVVGPQERVDGCYSLGWVPLGGSAELQLELRNIGNRELSLDAPTLGSGSDTTFALVDPVPSTLEAGARQTLTVRFSPTELGARTATVQIAGPEVAQAVCVQGRGGGPLLQCEPTTIDFGPLPLGRNRFRTVTCTNAGWDDPTAEDELQLEGWAVSGPDLFGIWPVGADLTLGVGETVSLELAFAAHSVGRHESQVQLRSNGGTVRFEVTGEAVELLPCDPVVDPAERLDLGPVSTLPVTREVVLRNDRPDACVVGDVGIGGPGAASFELASSAEPSILQPGAVRRIAVTARPTLSVSQAEAELQIAWGEPRPVKRLALIAGGSNSCLRIASAPSLTAPAGCTSVPGAIRVENHCAVRRTIESVALEDDGGGAWSLLEPARALALEPGEVAPVGAVRFSPDVPGPRYSAVRIRSDAGDLVLPLAGSGHDDGAVATERIGPDAVDVLFLTPNGSTPLARDDGSDLLASALAGGSDFRVAFAGGQQSSLTGVECWPGLISTGPGGSWLESGQENAARLDGWTRLSNLPFCSSGDPYAEAIAFALGPALGDRANGLFLRPAARLAVVFLTADAWTPANEVLVPYWIDRVERMRPGPGGAKLFAEQVQLAGRDESATWRLSDAVALGSTLFTRPACYGLAEIPADPASIEVSVSGTPLARVAGDGSERFSYDAGTGRLCFATTAIPRADATIEVRYAPGCVN